MQDLSSAGKYYGVGRHSLEASPHRRGLASSPKGLGSSVDDFVAAQSTLVQQDSTGERQMLTSQVVDNKLLLPNAAIRLGLSGSPVNTRCSFTCVFNNLEKLTIG